jgi:hypothetical protein
MIRRLFLKGVAAFPLGRLLEPPCDPVLHYTVRIYTPNRAEPVQVFKSEKCTSGVCHLCLVMHNPAYSAD